MSAAVVMYATGWCPYCERARQLLKRKGVEVTEVDIDKDPALREQMMQRSGRRTVPQIFVGDVHVDPAGAEGKKKWEQKPTAPGIPRRSPIQVLTRPDPA